MAESFILQAFALSLVLSASVAAVALLRPVARRLGGPRAQYLLWWAVPLCLLAARLPAPPVALSLAPPETSSAVQALPWKTSQVLREAPAKAAEPAPLKAAASALPLAWASIALLLGAVVLRQHLRWRQKLQWLPQSQRWSLPAGHSPSVIGLWRPQLALPVDFGERFEPAEQRLILAHEAVHARRRDTLWNGLATLLCVLSWFNPLAWWALRRFQRDQELACDATALGALPDSERRPYWDALLKAHDLSPSSALARGWRSPHPLIERLRWVQQGSRGSRTAGRLLVPGLALGLATAVYATHGAGIGSFGGMQPNPKYPPVGRLEVRTQVDGGRWTQESIQLGSTRVQHSEITHTEGFDRKPIFGMTLGVDENERGELEAWMRVGDARTKSGPDTVPGRAQLRVKPGSWARVSTRTSAGHLVRAELRLIALNAQAASATH